MTDTAGAAAAIDQVMPLRLRRRVEVFTAATVPLVRAEPGVEPNDLALLALACQRSERLRFVSEGISSGPYPSPIHHRAERSR